MGKSVSYMYFNTGNAAKVVACVYCICLQESHWNRDVAAGRALASHQCGLGLIPTQCHMCVEFVLVLPCSDC